MDTVLKVNPILIQQGLSGDINESTLRDLIETLQSHLDQLLPVANREFANVATEAFDMSQGRQRMGLEEALDNITVLQSELDAILFPGISAEHPALLATLPSPEMLFSDPEHVPRFIDWSTQSSHVQAENDWQLGVEGRNSISSQGSINPLLKPGDNYDA